MKKVHLIFFKAALFSVRSSLVGTQQVEGEGGGLRPYNSQLRCQRYAAVKGLKSVLGQNMTKFSSLDLILYFI